MKTSSTLRITVAVAILAGAGLSGCAVDPYYDNRGYSQGYSQGYNQPVYSQQRYYDANTQGNYYDPNRAFYRDRPYYYQR